VYSRVYWISDTALAAFAFLATYELFSGDFSPVLQNSLLSGCFSGSSNPGVTVLVSCSSLMGGHLFALALTTRIFVFLRAAILGFFVALMIMMGRQWTKQEFAIAFGFGLDVSTSSILLGDSVI